MAEKQDLTRFFELMENARDVNHQNYAERYCLFVEHIRELDMINVLEKRFSELVGSKYERKPKYDIAYVGSAKEKWPYYEIRLLFLKKLVLSDDIGGVVRQESYNFGHEHDQYTLFFDALLEPIADFIKQHCKDLYYIDDSPFGLNAEDVVHLVNDWFKREKLLIANPRYFLDREFEHDEKLFFVVGAFENLHEKRVLGALEKATKHSRLAQFQVRVQDARAPTVNRITDDIWKYICSSKGIIVDLCKDNFNVAYEVGIAHALGKSTIFLANTEEYPDLKQDLPLDIDDIRVIPYDREQLEKLTDDVVDVLLGVVAEKENWPKTGIDIQIS